ncbi:MAG: hypothetical protein ACREXM_15350 [Gammaproteobacteria bacterium]
MSNLALQSEGSRSTDCPACPGKPVLERIETRTAQIGEAFSQNFCDKFTFPNPIAAIASCAGRHRTVVRFCKPSRVNL